MQVTDHIQAVRIPFQIPVAPGRAIDRFVYAFVVSGDDSVCLVDSGVAGSEEALLAAVREAGREPGDVSTLVITHAHPDHIGAAKALVDATGCEVVCHAADRAWIEDTDLQCHERPVPGFDVLVGGPVPVARCVGEGDVLDLGGVSLQIMHTPGHSPGSISLWSPEDNALICADAVPLPGSLPIYDDVEAVVASVKRLQAVDDIAMLLSSWDSPRQGGAAYEGMAEGLDYIRRIHEAVLDCAGGEPVLDPMDLCRAVMAELGLSIEAANPLTARSFMAHLHVAEMGL